MLNCKQNNGGDQFAPNVYVQEGVIADVETLTGTTPKNFREPVELGIKLFIQANGLSFQPEIMLFGKLKRDELGTVSDWGGAFVVRDALCGIAGYDGPIADDLKIPDAVLRALLNKRVFYCRYAYGKDPATGKAKFSTFNQVGATKEAAIERWSKSRAKGYPKDYVADLDNAPDAYSTAAPVAAPAEGLMF